MRAKKAQKLQDKTKNMKGNLKFKFTTEHTMKELNPIGYSQIDYKI